MSKTFKALRVCADCYKAIDANDYNGLTDERAQQIRAGIAEHGPLTVGAGAFDATYWRCHVCQQDDGGERHEVLEKVLPPTCADCGKDFPVLPKNHIGGTGYAILPNGAHVCYSCADARQREDLKTADKFGAYLSGDGKRITTWTGGELARVVGEGQSQTGWHGSNITYVNAVAPDGSLWYGKGGGRGMCIVIRRRKAKGGARHV